MPEDEQLVYGKLIAAVQGEDIAASRNAAMKLVATLIVDNSPSLADAEASAFDAARLITEMVKLHWGSPLDWRGV
jgi:hypothetical protein